MYKKSFGCKINCTEVKCAATRLHKSADERDRAASRSLFLQKKDPDSDSTPLVSTSAAAVRMLISLLISRACFSGTAARSLVCNKQRTNDHQPTNV